MERLRSNVNPRLAKLEVSVERLRIDTTENKTTIRNTTTEVARNAEEFRGCIKDLSVLQDKVHTDAKVSSDVAQLQTLSTQHSRYIREIMDGARKQAEECRRNEREINGEIGSLCGKTSSLNDRINELGGRSVWSMLRTR